MKQSSRSYDFLWLGIALMPLLFIALLLPLTPHDYWWYLRLGRDIVETRAIPSVETYSFTQAGKPIMYHPWLSAVVFWLTYDFGNLNLTFLLRAVLIGLSYGLLWIWLRQTGVGPRLAALVTFAAGVAGSNNWSFRPQLFGYLFFMATLVLLWQWERKGKHFSLLFLPLISGLWVNMHGSFLLFFLLAGSALIFGRGDRKMVFIILAVSFAVTLINPYGFNIWKEMIGAFLVPGSRSLSGEWMPPVNLGWQMNIFFAWVLLMIPLAAFSSRRLSVMEWIMFLGMLWMSLSGTRYIVWGLFLLAGTTANLLANWKPHWLDGSIEVHWPFANYLLGVILFLVPLLALPSVREVNNIQMPSVISPDTPVEAVAWLANHPELPGPLWSDMVFSSYLIQAMPSRPVWIDTRFEVIYPIEQYEIYSRIGAAAPGWQELLDKEGINLLLLSRHGQLMLIEALQDSVEWCGEYQDSVSAIFVRCTAP